MSKKDFKNSSENQVSSVSGLIIIEDNTTKKNVPDLNETIIPKLSVRVKFEDEYSKPCSLENEIFYIESKQTPEILSIYYYANLVLELNFYKYTGDKWEINIQNKININLNDTDEITVSVAYIKTSIFRKAYGENYKIHNDIFSIKTRSKSISEYNMNFYRYNSILVDDHKAYKIQELSDQTNYFYERIILKNSFESINDSIRKKATNSKDYIIPSYKLSDTNVSEIKNLFNYEI